MRNLILVLLLTGCAYTYEPDIVIVDKTKYNQDLSECQDYAQPSLEESLLAGISPIAHGAQYGGSIGERIDTCMKEKGYNVKEQFTLWHL